MTMTCMPFSARKRFDFVFLFACDFGHTLSYSFCLQLRFGDFICTTTPNIACKDY